MVNAVAWLMFALGIGHIGYGLIVFRRPLAEAVMAGYIGQFRTPELRATAFWFLIFGPLLMLAGQAGIHAVAVGDLALLRLVGIYLFVTALAGVAAMPKSPFWAALISSPVLIAAGYGLLQ